MDLLSCFQAHGLRRCIWLKCQSVNQLVSPLVHILVYYSPIIMHTFIIGINTVAGHHLFTQPSALDWLFWKLGVEFKSWTVVMIFFLWSCFISLLWLWNFAMLIFLICDFPWNHRKMVNLYQFWTRLGQPGHRLSTLEIIDYPGLDHVYNVLISFYGFTM